MCTMKIAQSCVQQLHVIYFWYSEFKSNSYCLLYRDYTVVKTFQKWTFFPYFLLNYHNFFLHIHMWSLNRELSFVFVFEIHLSFFCNKTKMQKWSLLDTISVPYYIDAQKRCLLTNKKCFVCNEIIIWIIVQNIILDK
jgi:hypothetical protein